MEIIKKIKWKLVDVLGYKLISIHKFQNINGMYYENVLPSAGYAPWRSDIDFIETFSLVQSNTLVDKYRCYELWELVEQTAKLEGCIIEVGVWRGGTGALMAKRAKLQNIDATVYLCDTFSGVVKAGEKDASYKGGEHSDTSVDEVLSLTQDRLKLDNVELLSGIFPEDTARDIKEDKVRLCHIDVDVYKSSEDVMAWVWDRLVVGGMVVYDDYGFLCCTGVTRHVNEQKHLDDRIVIHNLNGHAVVIKIK